MTTSIALDTVTQLLERPFLDLVFEAASVHRQHHDPSKVQCSQLLSIKTGGCSEDCGYCSQSARHGTSVKAEPLMPKEEVLAAARQAREEGATRFCMGAAWREVKDGQDFEEVLELVRGVHDLGLESCVTLGMVRPEQATRLKEAGLDFYNHNLDTGRSYYDKVIGTRTYDDRLDTLASVREAGLQVCCGGIVGLGEAREVRAELLHQLAVLEPAPESVPINALVPAAGTPLESQTPLDWTEVVRTVAAARILMPAAQVRLSAGRESMDQATQALCFLAGANSIFLGERLLTVPNADPDGDHALLHKLGLAATGSSR